MIDTGPSTVGWHNTRILDTRLAHVAGLFEPGGDLVCQPPTCADGVVNQDESDVERGGVVCSPCGLGQSCDSNSDCASGICRSGTCE